MGETGISDTVISVQEAPMVDQLWLLSPLSSSQQLLKESAVSRKVWWPEPSSLAAPHIKYAEGTRAPSNIHGVFTSSSGRASMKNQSLPF